MPIRIQRQRTKGWKMPDGAVYVGRPTQWGNPFVLGPKCGERCRDQAVNEFRRYVTGRLSNGTGYPLEALRGKDLVCWCPLDQPCHGDVLLALANRD